MPEDTHAHIGARLQEVRKRRGLTQRGLEAASGVSLSLIRKLEQGERTDTRLETVRRLAVALHVPTSQLISASLEQHAGAATLDLWEPVRRALLTPPPLDDDEPPTTGGVSDAINATMPLIASVRFAELGAILPTLLRDASALADMTPDGSRVQGRLLQLTGWLLTQTRQFDAADMALQRALAAAEDRHQAAAIVNSQCWLLLRRGMLAEARNLAVHWADEMEPRMSRATPEDLSVWGWMLLRVAAASIRDNRPGEAEDALRLAQSAAVALGREYTPAADFLRTFGPVTVALKRAETAMIADHPDQVLKIAPKMVASGQRTTPSNWHRHRLDVANAHVRHRQHAEAVEVLTSIREAAPQWLAHQRYARDIVGQVVAKRRSLTGQMRDLADAVGLPM